MNKVIRVILGCVGLTFLFVFWWWNVFRMHQNELCSESSIIFAGVMEIEKNLQIQRRFGKYDPKRSPNKIPRVEKREWCSQDFLFYRDSTRHFLDSLFQEAILKQKIPAMTAVRCKWEGRAIDTCSDSLFYKSALPLAPLVYRISDDPGRNISIQAYVKFPFEFIWSQSRLMWIIPCLWLFSLGVFLGVYYLMERKRRKAAERGILPLVQDITIPWTKLSEELLFDDKHGDLLYENRVNVRLTDNSLKLFSYFLRTEQYKLTYEVICEQVLSRVIKNEATKSDKDAVANSVRHLRSHLEPIPIIEVRTIRGIGYELVILPSDREQQPGNEPIVKGQINNAQ